MVVEGEAVHLGITPKPAGGRSPHTRGPKKVRVAPAARGRADSSCPVVVAVLTIRQHFANMKAVKKVLPAQRPHWVGNGFHVFPVFAHYAFSNELSPWLMFDYAAPKHFEPTAKRLGVGQHPHRGFETVTIAWQGEVEHSDSVGNNDVIGAGDVQWMTAGRGATFASRV